MNQGGENLVNDALANAFINITLFTVMVLLVKRFEYVHSKNYTPEAWINLKKSSFILFAAGIITALLYKLLVGLIGVFNGTMELVMEPSGIVKSITFAFVSSFGFLGVALFEEALFRGYIMQIVLKKLPKLLGITVQALVFGLLHYINYSIKPHTWINTMDAILLGIIFGIISLRTNSLMFAIGAHLSYNTSEQLFFLDNTYKFTRLISFQNSSSSGLLGILAYTEFTELIILSIITAFLFILFRKYILSGKTGNCFSDTAKVTAIPK